MTCNLNERGKKRKKNSRTEPQGLRADNSMTFKKRSSCACDIASGYKVLVAHFNLRLLIFFEYPSNILVLIGGYSVSNVFLILLSSYSPWTSVSIFNEALKFLDEQCHCEA